MVAPKTGVKFIKSKAGVHKKDLLFGATTIAYPTRSADTRKLRLHLCVAEDFSFSCAQLKKQGRATARPCPEFNDPPKATAE
jgi:hypothetical protein